MEWQKSTFSSGDVNQDCLEVATQARGHLGLRESDHADAVITSSTRAFLGLLTAIKTHDVDEF